MLEAERADRRHLTSAFTAPGNGNGDDDGPGPKPGRQQAMTSTALAGPIPPPLTDDLDAVLRRMRFRYLRKAAPAILAAARGQAAGGSHASSMLRSRARAR